MFDCFLLFSSWIPYNDIICNVLYLLVYIEFTHIFWKFLFLIKFVHIFNNSIKSKFIE